MSFLWYWPGGGWDFEKWKARQTWKPITSVQSGKADPIDLGDWENQKANWRAVSSQILGELTDRPPDKVTFEWLGDELLREKPAPYTMRRLRYRLTPDEWGYAWYLVPKSLSGKAPTVIALHQTNTMGK